MESKPWDEWRKIRKEKGEIGGVVVEEREAAAASLGKKKKQTDESEGRGNQKKRESKKERGLTGFLREEGLKSFLGKK